MKLLSRRVLARSVLASAASDAAAIGLMATATWLIIRAAGRPELSALALGIAAVRAFSMIRGVLRYAERLASHDAALRALAGLRVRVYGALAASRPARQHSGDALATAVGEVDAVTDLVVRSLIPAGGALVVAFGAVGWFAATAPEAAALLAAGLIATGVLVPLIAAWRARRFAADTTAQADLSARTVDLLAGAADLAVAGATDAALAAASTAGRRLTARQRSAPAHGATALVVLGSGLTALAVLANTHNAVLTLATLAIFEICTPLPAAARHFGQARASLRRIEALLGTAEPASVRVPAAGPVEIRDLRVGYAAGEPPALDGVTLRLSLGQRVALVGHSGSGKSTLLAALVGLAPLSSGTITIGGVPAAECDLPRCITGVLADAHVFHASIADNIRIGDPDAGDEAVEDAARRAALFDWIQNLPAGLSTVVGEDAALLSGGQRQRLLLARALLADSPVLLLDEPSEGLDAATADAVLHDLLAATTGRATLLVTHRLAGLDAVDEVALLDAGRIVARGEHKDLIEQPGPYRDLWNSQGAVPIG